MGESHPISIPTMSTITPTITTTPTPTHYISSSSFTNQFTNLIYQLPTSFGHASCSIPSSIPQVISSMSSMTQPNQVITSHAPQIYHTLTYLTSQPQFSNPFISHINTLHASQPQTSNYANLPYASQPQNSHLYSYLSHTNPPQGSQSLSFSY